MPGNSTFGSVSVYFNIGYSQKAAHSWQKNCSVIMWPRRHILPGAVFSKSQWGERFVYWISFVFISAAPLEVSQDEW